MSVAYLSRARVGGSTVSIEVHCVHLQIPLANDELYAVNYLAHLYLAADHHDAVLGSLMGDFVKGPLAADIPQRRRQAIEQHRWVDSWTDSHPIVKRSKARISPRFRRYAPILIDVFYDHFLALSWRDHARVELPAFTDHIYQVLGAHHALLPERMQPLASYMAEFDLLGSYQHVAGIRRALRGIERRLKRPSDLAAALVELETHYQSLAADFQAFLPQLVYAVDKRDRDAGWSLPSHYTHRAVLM